MQQRNRRVGCGWCAPKYTARTRAMTTVTNINIYIFYYYYYYSLVKRQKNFYLFGNTVPARLLSGRRTRDDRLHER